MYGARALEPSGTNSPLPRPSGISALKMRDLLGLRAKLSSPYSKYGCGISPSRPSQLIAFKAPSTERLGKSVFAFQAHLEKRCSVRMTVRSSFIMTTEGRHRLGACSGGVTPVPIPNTAVKPASSDGTWTQPGPGRVARRQDSDVLQQKKIDQ